MEDYIRARPDIFFVGRDGSLRSNRVLCQLAGQYGVDLFIGSTLQMDGDANSSTVTLAVSPASAAHPTWATIRKAAVTAAPPGSA